jgi:NTE family protein
MIGAIYCDDYQRDDMKQQIQTIKPRDVLDLAILRLGKGVFTGNALQQYVHSILSAQDFSELTTKLVVTAVDVDTNEIVALESGPIAPAINASCALPPFFHAVQLYGYLLVDGGVIDPVPVVVAQQYNPQMTIAVDVSPKVTSKWPSNLLSRFIQSYNMTIARLGYVHATRSDVVITPEVGDVDLFDFTNRIQLYHKGIEAAEKKLNEIKQLTDELT